MTLLGCLQVFHAGTSLNSEGKLVATGGRVLAVTALADSVKAAQQMAYMVRHNLAATDLRL